MAFSQHLTDSQRKKTQTALVCQLCENDQMLKWKCVDCDLLLCQKCRDIIHPKFASAEDHTIIAIKEISKHQADPGPKPDLKRIKCSVHSGQKCCLFCKTCYELVCQTCITQTHNEHKFGDINNEYKIKMEKIRNGQKNIENEMRTLTVTKQKLKLIKSNEQSNYDKVKQEIMDYDKALKNEIQKHTNKLVKELDQKWDNVLKSLEYEEKELREEQSTYQKLIHELNNLQSNVRDVFSGSYSTEIIFPHSKMPAPRGVPKFIPGDKTKVPLIHGKFEDVIIKYNTELKVDKKFETDLKRMTSVVPCPDGSFWISNSISGIIQQVKFNGDNFNVMTNLKLEVYDAALLPSGDLLFSNGSSRLKLIPSGSTDIQDSVYTLSPLVSTAIHVTCDNKVIAGAIDRLNIKAAGTRQIIVMDQIGHHEKVFQLDRHGKPLFSYPYRIARNSQCYIAVVDWVSDDGTGQVVVLDQESGIRNIYTGHTDINNEDNPFRPRGIKTTQSDNFVVADFLNHTLHILNSKGEIFTFYKTEEMGILLPFSMSFSTTGKLYIGCSTLEEKENAKLFIVNKYIW